MHRRRQLKVPLLANEKLSQPKGSVASAIVGLPCSLAALSQQRHDMANEGHKKCGM